MNNSTPLVAVICIVYNHEKYLQDCIESLLMQHTNFRYVVIIHDDCSTDSSVNIISSYVEENPDILVPFYEKENQYSIKKGAFMKDLNEVAYATGAKYVAFCEGDDYWIDPLKLQKQVDFMEKNPEYSLIGSNGLIKYTDINDGLKYFNNHDKIREITFEELVNTWVFPTASLLCRNETLRYFPEWSKELHFSDDVIVMTCAIHGKVATLGELSCVYRKGSGITKEMDKKHEYMAEQHKLFYSHLLEDTGNKYKEVLEARIAFDERNRIYWNTRNKSKLLTAIVYPKVTLKNAVKKIVNTVINLTKRCLRII